MPLPTYFTYNSYYKSCRHTICFIENSLHNHTLKDFMSLYLDHIIELFQEEELRFFYVEKVDKGQLHIVDRNGKRNRVPETRIIFLFPQTTNSESATSAIDRLQEEISSMMHDIDTLLLWESVPENDREYTIAELSHIYFNQPSILEQSALFRALREDQLHFKRKGVCFHPRKQQQIDEITMQAEKDKEKKEKIDKLHIFFKTVFAAKTQVIPEPFFATQLNEMKHRLYQHRIDLPEEILQSLYPRRALGNLIYEVLHKTDTISKEENRFLIEAGIPGLFSTEIEAEADKLKQSSNNQNRVDLTNLDIFSIDDESTREVDDALSIEMIDGGYRIGVHISDVSSWIKPNSLLDKEAQRRISSIYLETGVIPMFPESLSCNRMSLQSGEIREALSLVAKCTDDGSILTQQFVISNIIVKNRLSYDGADALLLEDNDNPLSSKLRLLKNLTDKWKQQRLDTGAIEINKPEFNLEVRGEEIILKLFNRLSPSRYIVSECMILFNKLAAQYALEKDIPVIYRAQEPPNEMPAERTASDEYNPLITDQIMRQMRPGRLTTIPLPHSGLGVDIYTQLSSPIRRYADLILQRQITSSLQNVECPYGIEELFEILASVDENEKLIREVYQRSRLYWLIRYLDKYRKDDVFQAMIINMNPRQAFVELLELGYRVALPGSSLYKIGQILALKVKKLDAEEGVMLFET